MGVLQQEEEDDQYGFLKGNKEKEVNRDHLA